MFIAYVMTENTRVRAPPARMRFRPCQRTVGRACAVIGTDAHERRLQRCAHIVFAHHEKDRAGLPMIRNDEIKKSVEWILVLCGGNLGKALALPIFQIPVHYRSDEYPTRSAAAEIDVFPVF